MRRLGVLIFLMFITSSMLSIILYTNINKNTGVNGVISSNSNENIDSDPKLSNSQIYDYFPEDIPYYWEDLAGKVGQSYVRNITELFTDKDDGYYHTRLPFNFEFYKSSFIDVYISTNGYLSFNATTPTLNSNPDFPISGTEYSYIIAPFWDDLDLNKGGSVIIANFTSGIDDKWVLEFKNVNHYYNNYIGSFELILYESGIIQFNFQEINYTNEGYTTGINLGDGKHFFQDNRLYPSLIDFSFKLQYEFTIFYDDFESGVKPEWSGIGAPNLWHITTNESFSGTHSLWCANESTGTYEKFDQGSAIRVRESVTINDLDFSGYYDAYLKFWYKKITENSQFYDIVEISVNIYGDQFYLNPKYVSNDFPIKNINWDNNTWTYFEINLTFLVGFKHVDVIITFDTIDSTANKYSGFKIDDIQIVGYRKQIFWVNSLGIEEGDEYKYYIMDMDPTNYWDVFEKDPIGKNQDEIKIKIMKIENFPEYWKITTRFWDFGTDIDNDGDSEEKIFYIYKYPVDMKSGVDFFIPNDDVWAYVRDADNINDSYGYIDYNIFTWEDIEYNEVIYEMRFKDFRVELRYDYNGILRALLITKNDYSWNWIYGLYIVDWEEDDYDEGSGSNMEDIYVNIPGYDLFMVLAIISVSIVVLYIKRMKKLS
ncbi:MAG: Loki-CTERM sorting domain-containing protein [Promethearchaeota archaeon]